MIEKIESWDRALFLVLNGTHNDIMDVLLVAASNAVWWTPVFLFVLFHLFKNYTGKAFLWILLGVILSITLTDRLSVEAFKEVFQRYRPCHNLDIRSQVVLLKDSCGGMYGFVSSHAANFAGLGYLFYKLLKGKVNGIGWLMLLWVSIVCYSRIYMGVHYPLDVIGGSMLGVTVAWIIFKVLERRVNEIA